MKDKLANVVGERTSVVTEKGKPLHTECFTINLENSDQPGSHWTATWKKGRGVRYFDSFGTPIPKEVNGYHKKYKPKNFHPHSGAKTEADGKVKRESDNLQHPLQKYSTYFCGELCLLFHLLCQKVTRLKTELIKWPGLLIKF